MKKDTVYIDIDDEITTITDKVNGSKSTIIALVLPKRCTVLQSPVNMKILKKSSTAAGKNVVLITSEASLIALAGSTGFPVAKSLQSKPVIPSVKNNEPLDEEEHISEDDGLSEPDKQKPIGDLDDENKSNDEEDPIEIGDDSDIDSVATEANKDKQKPPKKDKKLKVPNFDKFRLKLFIAIAVIILLIVGIVLAIVVLPRANVTITTENKSIPIKISLTGSTTAKNLDINGNIVPVNTKNISKTETKQFQASGQKDVGTKASGTMTVINCNDNTTAVPAGTLFTNNGFSFTTTADASVPGSNFTSGGACKEDGVSAAISVVATNGGDNYNLSAGRIYNSNKGSTIYGKGSAMSGGTTKLVTVVSQDDCNNASNAVLNINVDTYKSQLANDLKTSGSTPVKDTFTQTHTTPVCSPAVGQEAASSTVSSTFKFGMSGLSTDALKQLVQSSAEKAIQSGQSIFDNGLENATITIDSQKKTGELSLTLTANAQTGIKQDSPVIASSIAGKKYGQSIQTIKDQPGVADVVIKYSPFWVNSTPKNTKHITVNFVSSNDNK